HDAIGAVELAAGRLGVEVAAGDDRRQVWVAPRAAGKDVADLVNGDAAAGFLAPADKEAARRGVEIAGGEAADATLLGRADLGQLHQARPQALAVYREVAHRRHPISKKRAKAMLT